MNAKKAIVAEEPEWPPQPRQNSQLIGHVEAEKTLMEALHSGRMAHAWMISGAKGIGKATLAYRFARYLLSQHPADSGPGLFGDEPPESAQETLFVDPASPIFQRVAAGSHGDLLTVERTLNDRGKIRGDVVVDDVREVGGFMGLTASEGGWRIVIIDSADEMNRNAANAVLKVLEEPPDRAILLLISHNPGQLLPTIRSRCRKLNLKALNIAEMDQLLTAYSPDLNAEDRSKLINLSDGSIGRAMGLIDAGGLDLYRDVLEVLATLPDMNMVKLHTLAEQLAKAGAEDQFKTATELLRSIVARFLRYQAESRDPEFALNSLLADEKQLFERLAAGAGLDRWLEVWEKMCGLLERTRAVNLDRKQIVLNIFLEFDGVLRNR